jgi:hypothetical protein
VSRRQLKEALIRLNMLDQIENLIKTQDAIIQNWWNEAAYFERYHPIIEEMIPIFNLTPFEVDNIFALADTL